VDCSCKSHRFGRDDARLGSQGVGISGHQSMKRLSLYHSFCFSRARLLELVAKCTSRATFARTIRARSSRHIMKLNRSRTAKYIGGAKARNIKKAGIRASPATKTHLLEGKPVSLVQGLSPNYPQTTPKPTTQRGFVGSRFRDCPRFRNGIHHAEGFDLKASFAS
jgi:hypothetical protein